MTVPSSPAATTGLHPSTEIVLVVCTLVVVYGISSPIVPVLILVVSLVTAIWSPRVRVVRWMLTLLVITGPILLMVGIIQGLFYPGEHSARLWEWGPIAVTVDGLAVAAQLWLRLTATVAVCALFAFGTDAARAFDGMLGLRVPVGVAYICSSALSLIPLFQTQTSRAVEARAARGWRVSRLRTRVALLPGILAGLLTSSLVQLDQRHETLTQRGLGASARPTPLQDHHDSRGQRVLRWAALPAAVVLVVVSAAGWLPLPLTSELLGGLDV
ncbi:energy-coupling factor transporter transmembrane component T family protein [Pseudoclavibacter sp. 13-3]|uniref:energy-coupling factor transporter transmembrane component T family protein n=1 Tax=Pseudoclavibacter sp. 13-3 TaxID=2901228 RepID=UPI001E3EABA5|nr:energy-coupling factor transporter transmembrane protein EcfT [Pseudoclavibacter sp. 13-3]